MRAQPRVYYIGNVAHNVRISYLVGDLRIIGPYCLKDNPIDFGWIGSANACLIRVNFLN